MSAIRSATPTIPRPGLTSGRAGVTTSALASVVVIITSSIPPIIVEDLSRAATTITEGGRPAALITPGVPFTWGAFGAFLGGPWATVQPVYYAYGQGGNVYYENNVVYVNGQAAGTPQEYYQQAQALAAAAPPADQVNAQQQDWLPLGVFALTSEDTGDSQTVLQLAVNKQGVIAGTYYNEANQVSRPIQGTADVKTQRAVMTFADNKNTDRVLETGINNLTQDEAPALLHFGAEQSQPVLLVRLKQPEPSGPAESVKLRRRNCFRPWAQLRRCPSMIAPRQG